MLRLLALAVPAAALGAVVLSAHAGHAPTPPVTTTAPGRAAPAHGQPKPPAKHAALKVTMIGDSVADELRYVPSAQRLLGSGVRLRLELAVCRRLVVSSCTVAGYQPSTALVLVQQLGRRLGPVVVMAVGYNDYELRYEGDVRQVLTALRQAGVEQVLWLTMRAVHQPYLPMNAVLERIAAERPDVTLVDWNRYSRSHPNWFDADGLHLDAAGAIAMATLVHKTLAGLGLT